MPHEVAIGEDRFEPVDRTRLKQLDVRRADSSTDLEDAVTVDAARLR